LDEGGERGAGLRHPRLAAPSPPLPILAGDSPARRIGYRELRCFWTEPTTKASLHPEIPRWCVAVAKQDLCFHAEREAAREEAYGGRWSWLVPKRTDDGSAAASC